MKNNLYFVFLLLSCFSFSQEIEITGTVKDSLGVPLESANVIALLKSSNKLASYSVTNSKGKYQLSLESSKSYVLNVSYLGFQTITYEITLDENDNDITKDFILSEDKGQLDEVVLTYQMPIVVKNDTIQYNTDSFTNGTERKLGDILKKLPGIEINTDGQIEVEGVQVKKVMVEGKDFFDGDSKLAVENIPSDAVDKVEVLKNFNEISQLKQVTNNDDSFAINLKLKEGKKTFWFGQLSAGAGIASTEESLYKVNPKLFYFSPKKSVSLITNFNDIGEIPFTRRDFYRFTGGIRQTSSGSGTSLNLSADNLGLSQLQNNMANEIDTKFAAVNLSYAVNDAWDLSGFLIYSGSEVDLLEKSLTQYVGNGLLELTENNTIQKNDLGLVKLSSLYKPNKNFQFDYDIFLKISDQEESDKLFSNFADVNNTINTTQNDSPFSLQQNANIYYTLNNNHIFSSEVQYLWSKEVPFYNASFLDLGANPSEVALPFSTLFPYDLNQENYSINQNKTIKTNKLDAKLDYYYVFNKNSNIKVTLGSIFSKQLFDSNMFQTLDNGSENEFTDTEFTNNHVTFNFNDVFLGVDYRLITGKFTFIPSLNIHNYKVQNEQLGSVFSTSKTLVLPSFFAKLQLQKSEKIQFTYSKTAQFADIHKIVEGYVFNNYNSLFQGNRTIDNGIYENYRLNYSSFSLFNYTIVNASVNYSKRNNNIKNNIIFNQINRVSTPVNIDVADETLSFSGRWEKTIGKYKVNLRANVGLSEFYNIVNDNLVKSKSFTQNYTASMLTNFKKWPNFEVGYQRSINEYTNPNNENTFFTERPFVNLEALIKKVFTLKAEYSYFNYANETQTLNKYAFMDVNLRYQNEDSKWEYMLGVTNVFDTSSINRDSFNQNFTNTTEYFVQPRYLVFSLKYNL